MSRLDDTSNLLHDGDVESVEERRERVHRCELPGRIATLVDAYENTVGERDRFLWKWLYFVFPAFTLSCVDAKYEERVRDEKLLASMFVVVLDDLGERQMNRPTFEETAKLPFDHQSPQYDREGVDVPSVEFCERVWNELEALLADAPREREYRSLFEFDVKQNVNAIDYSYTLNQHLEMANVAENEMYDCNNMMLFTYANIDIMHAPSFARGELATLRGVVLKAQEMARIGNWVTTWKREFREGDYSSGVVVYALENGIVEREELYELSADRFEARCDELVERITDHGVEELFLDQWHRRYEEIRELDGTVETVDVGSFLSGMEKVMSYHLASRGLK